MKRFCVLSLSLAMVVAVLASGAAYADTADAMANGDAVMMMASLPMDMMMTVTSVNGMPVAPDSKTSIAFNSGGTAGGNASVNEFTAQWKMEGDALAISDVSITTTMSGDPAMMDQEKMFLDTLSMVEKFSASGGKINLMAKDGKMIELSMPETAM
jgi:heat shock protein HslJ